MERLLVPAALLIGVGFVSAEPARNPVQSYCWKDSVQAEETLLRRIEPPAGFKRVVAAPGGFAEWLRGLPLKQGNPSVFLYDGRPKARQDVHVAVVDIDVGKQNLQQCADAVMRLRAEYLFSGGKAREVSFGLTNGQRASFSDWSSGLRPTVKRDKVTWRRSGAADTSHRALRAYLDFVFAYAGTLSLSRELKPLDPDSPIEGGDVFILGGSPGHAVIVLDVAADPSTGRRVFLLAQSYMPAQEIHILKNPGSAELSPWYEADASPLLITPEWTFKRTDRKRF